MKESILQFCPNTFPHILESKTITYKGKELKTSYLIDLMHTFIVRKYMHGRKEQNLWSVILRKKYGTFYNYYIDWLLDHDIIRLKKKWKAGFNGKAKLYTLSIDVHNKNIIRVPNTDKYLLRKINRFERSENIKLTPIYQTMIDDLKHVKLDYNKAKSSLDAQLDTQLISEKSYFKNAIAIDAIRNNIFYFTKDEYGRLHTNFTNLKKSIRNNYLTIDDQEIESCDIKNCQPKLLAKIILNKEKKLSPELALFIKSVKDNTFYSTFDHLNITRDQIKKVVFQVFFGKNKNNKNNIYFKEVWPAVWNWIVRLKREKQNHKHLSHLLQQMESDLIYNKICTEIKEVSKDIILFTVHDGLFFQKKYSDIVIPIFEKYENEII